MAERADRMNRLADLSSRLTVASALRIAAHFGVDGAAASEIRGGWINDNWLVEDRTGERFVVRRYWRLYLTHAAVEFEHALMRHVSARVPEVHPPLWDSSGESVFHCEGRYCAVFPYVEGTTGDRTAATSAAGVLVRFHPASRDFRPVRPRRRKSATVLRWFQERFERFAKRPELAGKIDWGGLIGAVSRAITRLEAYVSPPERLPFAVVHGDPHPDNFVVRDGQVVGLIDFDFTHETERAYDVASGADAFAREDEDAALDFGRAIAFAAAYHPELGDPEWRLVPEFMIRRNAFLVWYVVTRHGQRAFGDIGNADRYAHRVVEVDAKREEWEAMTR